MSSMHIDEMAGSPEDEVFQKAGFATGQKRFVTSNNGSVCYRVFNPERTDLPGLLLIHGIFAHSHWWDHIVPFFSAAFRVTVMDLSGMGNSDKRASYTFRGFAEDIVAVSLAADLQPVTIVAHSFSGTPTAFACHGFPEFIYRAVIIDSRMSVPGMSAMTSPKDDAMILRRSKKIYPSFEGAISRYRLLPSGRPVSQALLRHIAGQGLAKVEGGWAWKFDETLDPLLPNDPNGIVPAGILTPIDYIYGEKSDVISATMVALIKAHLPSCSTPIAIPDAGHHILLEHPQALVAALRSLFARPPVTAFGVL
jgi:pimeloyl-ACP methyl ester carboxylesterase